MIKKILISQPEPTSANSPYYDIAKRHNVEIVFRPFIKVEPLTPKEFRAQKISILEHTAIVFTSRLSIDNFFLSLSTRLAARSRQTNSSKPLHASLRKRNGVAVDSKPYGR